MIKANHASGWNLFVRTPQACHWDEIEEDDYTEALKTLLSKKAESLKTGTSTEKYQKCYRTGLSKGFEPGLVSQVLKGLFPKGFA